MPQFDFFSFFNQIIWLTLGSFTFYVIYTKYFITNSAQVMKMREKLKQSSLLFTKHRDTSVGYYNLAVKFFRNK